MTSARIIPFHASAIRVQKSPEELAENDRRRDAPCPDYTLLKILVKRAVVKNSYRR